VADAGAVAEADRVTAAAAEVAGEPVA
jgi:hypothetical protein